MKSKKKNKVLYYYRIHYRNSGTYVSINKKDNGSFSYVKMLPNAEELLSILDQLEKLKEKKLEKITQEIK